MARFSVRSGSIGVPAVGILPSLFCIAALVVASVALSSEPVRAQLWRANFGPDEIGEAHAIAEDINADHDDDESASCRDVIDGEKLYGRLKVLYVDAMAGADFGRADRISDAMSALGDALEADFWEYGHCPRPYAVVEGPSWTGFYVGAFGGGVAARSQFIESGVFSKSFAALGPEFGFEAGYLYQPPVADTQWKRWPPVYGFAVDAAVGNIFGSSDSNCSSCTARNPWRVLARGILGIDPARTLFYVTGGAAVGELRVGVPGLSGFSTTNVGWTAGGGVDKALTRHLSAKIEYLYIDLGHGSCTPATCGGTATVPFRASTVRFGLNYHF